MELTSLPVRQPRLELVGMKNIEDPFSGDFGEHGDGRCVGVELEVRHGVSVRCEDHLAPLINGEAGEVGVEVLAPRKAVDLDRHAGIGAGRKNSFPACLEPRTMMEVATSGVGEDVDFGRLDSAQKTFGLIAVRVEVTVNGGNHAIDLEAFALGHIEGAVDQDLDLEPLEKTVVFAMLIVPALDSPALEANPFAVETRRHLEAA